MKGMYHSTEVCNSYLEMGDSTLQEGDDSTEKDQARVDRTGDPGFL